MNPDPSNSPAPPELETADGAGNIKATREDWLNAALDLLVSEGIEQVKIQGIGARLGVSRSSFYWYFKSRQHLLNELLAHWDTLNTGALLREATKPSTTITEAVCNLFHCFIDDTVFNPQLDFAVREWSRRSATVRRAVDRTDRARTDAIAAMFERHGYPRQEAVTRARIVYFMQIGYYSLELKEPLEDRLALTASYLYCFTGEPPRPEEVRRLADFARRSNEAKASPTAR